MARFLSRIRGRKWTPGVHQLHQLHRHRWVAVLVKRRCFASQGGFEIIVLSKLFSTKTASNLLEWPSEWAVVPNHCSLFISFCTEMSHLTTTCSIDSEAARLIHSLREPMSKELFESEIGASNWWMVRYKAPPKKKYLKISWDGGSLWIHLRLSKILDSTFLILLCQVIYS